FRALSVIHLVLFRLLRLEHGQQLVALDRVAFLHLEMAQEALNLGTDVDLVSRDDARKHQTVRLSAPYPIKGADCESQHEQNRNQGLPLHGKDASRSRKRP